ncbi:hypothetical protein [Sphingomonas oligoaromativorans]|jgi:hypothetical protein|uniref:hypothetical protein n=1 Tax=Sphingomonas oligoaromativorans TaxID=575322 RepID=UPI00141DD0B3|nr:hypothetical protein [Sphingomonas oligoaromativorans]NIJ32012.1 hypothetical protein [Sphingomonas oligoaromativorans]
MESDWIVRPMRYCRDDAPTPHFDRTRRIDHRIGPERRDGRREDRRRIVIRSGGDPHRDQAFTTEAA